MKSFITIVLFLLSFGALAAPKVHIKFSQEKVKQGAIVEAVLQLNSETTLKIQYGQLRGQSLAGVFYIFSAKPLMTKGSWENLESEAEVILVKLPEKQPLIHKIGNDEIEVTWSPVEFVTTEASESFIFDSIQVPARSKLLFWTLILLGVSALAGLGYRLHKVYSKRRAEKLRKKSLKDSVLGVTDYDGAVELWKKKLVLTAEFPHLEDPFKKFEKVLYKYQFKARQSESEKAEVMDAYREFLSETQGGFRGV